MQIEFNAEEHQYTVDGILFPSVTQVLKIANEFDKIDKQTLSKAAKFGTAVHKMTELYDLGVLNMETVAVVLLPYLDGWKKFLSDTNFKPLEIECRIASKLGYAGTFDRLGYLDNKLTLVDIKTGSTLQRSTALQLAAYKHAYEEIYKKKIQQRIAIQLKPCSYVLKLYSNPTDFLTFINFLTVYKWVNYGN
jgi:ATP-dependent exoDNAse (exonuclease V) beta subunit